MPKIAYEQKRFAAATLEVIELANKIIEEYQAQGYNLTLRQLYYQLVARGYIPNRDTEYKRLGGIIADARLAGLIDWLAIEDRTRNLRANPHWASPREIVDAAASQYRIDKWQGQNHRVECWIEKDALLGVIAGVCSRLDVPYFSCRGYTSASEMWLAGRRLQRHFDDSRQLPVVLHLGDHDPSGIDMTRDIRKRLSLFGSGIIEVRRIALTMEQIEALNPPPNPAKTTDSRYQAYIEEYGDESWELDALEPAFMSDLIEREVGLLRQDAPWQQAVRREKQQQEMLRTLAGSFGTQEA